VVTPSYGVKGAEGVMETQYITIPNLSEDFVHYKEENKAGKRNIAWVKLHSSLLQKPEFAQLTNAERWVYLGIVLLVGRNKGKIPNDLVYIRQQISNGRLSKNMIEKFESLGLISTEMVPSRYQNGTEEKNQESITKNKEAKFVSKSSKNEDSELLRDLQRWNNSQTSPLADFRPENIIRKHGTEKIVRLFEVYGQRNGGFSQFLAALKNS